VTTGGRPVTSRTALSVVGAVEFFDLQAHPSLGRLTLQSLNLRLDFHRRGDIETKHAVEAVAETMKLELQEFGIGQEPHRSAVAQEDHRRPPDSAGCSSELVPDGA
jgi:hypothetical protein